MKQRVLVTVAILAAAYLGMLLLVLPFGRWWDLQTLGAVPANSSYPTHSDWRVATWTTWWGKPIAPDLFWTNRAIWNDDSANQEARRRGRGYPPIPTHRPDLIAGFPLAARSHADRAPGPFSGGPDSGPVIPLHYTDAESAYWNWFWKNKPKPPAILEREQFDVAKQILYFRKPLLIQGRNIHAARPDERARSEQTVKSRASEIGIPPEALTEEALFWTYVLRKRKEYAVKQERGLQFPRQERFAKKFIEMLEVDPKFITEDLTQEQVKTANAWKLAYLRRLRKEGADELCIDAYMKAWGISPLEVFPKEE